VSSSYTPQPRKTTFRNTLQAFGCQEGLPFANVLSEHDILQACQQHGCVFATKTNHIYNPALVVWAFLSQCLEVSKTCSATVARVLTFRAAMLLPISSADTAAYCKARARLPVPLLRSLTRTVGERLEDQALPSWRWKGRRAILVDGTTLSGPDTEANQAKYPQPSQQKKGLGFPLIRLVVLIALATGGILDAGLAAASGKQTGELALLQQMFESLRAGDVLVGDRYYGSYAMIALLQARGVDSCSRLNASRPSGAAAGQRLGHGDYLVEWSRPKKRPDWMSPEEYAQIPKTLSIREVHVKISVKGFRPEQVIVVTTLLDPLTYSYDEIAQLYRQRWNVELKIRSIKQSLKMDILRGKTPEMMEREVWGHLLVYNLARQAQAQAAQAAGCLPIQLSFTAALDQLRAGYAQRSGAEGAVLAALAAVLREALGQRRVGNRPDRFEPRRLKRRPKDCKLLTKTREQARAELQAGQKEPKTK
jgi:hypothetical protein